MKKTTRAAPPVTIEPAFPKQPPGKPVYSPPLFELSERQHLFQVLERADRIASLTDLDALLDQMLDLMIEVTEAESASYLQLDNETDELVVREVRGDDESQYLVGLRMKRQEGLLRNSEKGQTPIVIGDLISDPRWLRVVNPAKVARLINAVLLPVETNKQVLGIIQIYNFNQAAVEILQLLSSRLAHEIERLGALNHERQVNQQLHALLNITGRLAGTIDRTSLLHTVTEAACSLVNAGRSSIFIVDSETEEMAFHASYQATGQSRTLAKDLGSIAPSLAIHRQKPAAIKSGKAANNSSYFTHNVITVSIPSTIDSDDPESPPKSHIGEIMVFANNGAPFQENDIHLLESLAQQTSIFLKVADLHDNTAELFVDSISALVAAIDAKDPYTQGHSQRVSDYSVLIGRELNLTSAEINNLRVGSLFHDVGKIGIPDTILRSTKHLSFGDWEIVKRHPLTGLNILNKVKILSPSLPAILEHHERLDGSGYPGGLFGGQITLFGRIVAVADTFDAMTSDRPYRSALPTSQVLDTLRARSGILFDTKCVEALERIVMRDNPKAIGHHSNSDS